MKGAEAFDLDEVAPSRTAAQLTRPLLVAHGKRDTNVPFSQYTLFMNAAQKAKVPVEPLVFENAGHGFDSPADKERWLASLESFLARHNPAE